MDRGIPLFKVRGIQIRMHITFPLILAWGAIQFGLLAGRGLSGAAFGVVVTAILFAIVVLHELGHSVAAQSFGVPVRQIVLLPIGGVAQLGRIPEKPSQELVIAIAGPLVNFLLAGAMLVVGLVAGAELGLRNLRLLMFEFGRASLTAVFSYVFVSNLLLGLFNLLPAFPMDGGRILRALLATRMSYPRATSTAVTIGRGIAWLMGLWGFLGGGVFLVLIAVFIYVGAGQEGQMVQVRSVLRGLTVGQAYSRQVQSLTPASTLREAVELTRSTLQSEFPILQNGRLLGLLTHPQLIEGLNQGASEATVDRYMRTDVREISPGDSLYLAQSLLTELRVDALPVVEDGHFVGLVTSRDVSEVYRLASRWPDFLRTAEI